MPFSFESADKSTLRAETAPSNPVYSPRSAKVTFDIFSGLDTLEIGSQLARDLWNQARDQQMQHFQQTSQYLPLFKLVKMLRRQQGSLRLSDRCFSFLLRRYQGNLSTWLKIRNKYPHHNPPGVATKPQPLLFEVGRNAFPINPWTYKLTILQRQIRERFAVVKIYVRPGVKMEQVKLIQVQPDLTGLLTYYLKLQAVPPGKQIAGIDLGIYHLATVAFQSGESILYSGQTILELDQYTRQRTGQDKSRGGSTTLMTSQSSKKQQIHWRKTKNIRHLAIHNLTSHIVQMSLACQVGTLVIGDLTHIRRRKNWGKLGVWSYRQLTSQLIYKATQVGIRVISIKECYTSQQCHRCGQRGIRTQNMRLFLCPQCDNFMIDADVNGAFNILNRYAPVSTLARLELGDNQSDGTDRISKKVEAKDRIYLGPTYIATFAKNYSIIIQPNDGAKTLANARLLKAG